MADHKPGETCSACFTCQIVEMNRNLEYIAAGIAKFAERCFCGHRMDQHTPACTIANCEVAKTQTGEAVSCQTFTPWFLAVARIGNHGVQHLADLKRIVALLIAAPGQSPQIVTPFSH